MRKGKELTQIQRSWLEHLRRAEQQGVTLVQYAQSAGIKVGGLYEARRTLSRKGVPRPGMAGDCRAGKAAPFVAVEVAAPARVTGEVVCRLKHPLGWELQCAEWPAASWVAQLMQGGAHDSP
jgi:hypothetical protein